MTREKIRKTIEKGIKSLQKLNKLPKFDLSDILIEYPREKSHGDYSTNTCLKIAKIAKKNPMEIAELLKKEIEQSDLFDKVETASPGFINFFISQKYLQDHVKGILKQKDKFGNLKVGKKEKVNIEFISANPTGPLTLGNSRGGFCGDVLANVLEKAGYNPEREYYVNDIGVQILKLGHSVVKDSEAVYKGKYIDDLNKRISEKDPKKAGERASKIILKEMIKDVVKKDMGIKFDTFFSEKKLYTSKQIDKALDILKKKGLTYMKEDALWFKSTQFGDDKDRVLIKSNGDKTYLVSDIAYLKNKFDRGFKKLIYFWGADHHGYIDRVRAAAQALGYGKEQVEVITMQLVSVMKVGDGKKEIIRMSKREGVYTMIQELIEQVGLDAVRFFFLTRGVNNHLIFDLDLAKEQSQKNPVYYVQYAHARISSIIKKSKVKIGKTNLNLLDNEKELNLIKELIKFPEVVEDTAKDYQVQRLGHYATKLADNFHRFYEGCQVISEDKKMTQARLGLISATKITLKNVLELMGISSPEKM